jgi:hypothetical protein
MQTPRRLLQRIHEGTPLVSSVLGKIYIVSFMTAGQGKATEERAYQSGKRKKR